MKTKRNVQLAGLHPVMRPVLKAAESLWKQFGRPEGVTVVSTLDSVHSSGSWHPYGLAVDLRTRYFEDEVLVKVYQKLKGALPQYDVILHTGSQPHIHVEIGNELAKELGVLF